LHALIRCGADTRDNLSGYSNPMLYLKENCKLDILQYTPGYRILPFPTVLVTYSFHRLAHHHKEF